MYLYSYQLSTHGISGLAARGDCQQFEVRLKMMTNMYSPSLSHLRYPCVSVHPPSLFTDVLGGRDRASFEMHFEAVIE